MQEKVGSGVMNTTSPPHHLTTSQSLSRADLAKIALKPLHIARNWSKADVLIGEWPEGSGQRVVLKDLKPCSLWFRLLAGRYTQAREWRALVALQDLPAVPN